MPEAEKEVETRPTFFYPNGDRYEGQWLKAGSRSSIRHGKGAMTYKNGEVLDGMGTFDQANGKGKELKRNTVTYCSDF
jgi:hypothetical protein